MKTAMRMASVLAVVVGVSFVAADEAQAGGKFWGGFKKHVKRRIVNGYHHKPKHYVVKKCIPPCHDYHYGYCAYYKRYGHCRYFVPGPVGGPPPVGTPAAPPPGNRLQSPLNGAGAPATQPDTQPTASQNTDVAANNQNASEANPAEANAAGQLDPAQLAAIVAAVEQVLQKQKPAEQPKVASEILETLEQLVAQKVAEATQGAAAEAAPKAEQPLTAQQSPSESNDAAVEALREMLAQLAAQQQVQK